LLLRGLGTTETRSVDGMRCGFGREFSRKPVGRERRRAVG
jgi:hypothetical protein